jgi:polysaccharide pyruvyl transferase WcaK-like protein
MTPARVVLANVSADDNRGGCAITFATMSELQRALPDCELTLIAAAGIADLHDAMRHTRRAFPRATIKPPVVGSLRGWGVIGAAIRALAAARLFVGRTPNMSAFEPLSSVAGADLVVTRGDALFVDRRSLKGLLSICAATLPALLATRWGVPSVLSGTEIGPFSHAPSRLVCATILKRVGLVVARNDGSRQAAIALGVRSENVVVLPDTAFGFPRPQPADARAIADRFGLTPSGFAVVTVGTDSALAAMEGFESRLRDLLRRVLERSLVREIAVVLQVDGRHISDRQTTRQFVERAADPRIRFIDDDLTPTELTALNGAAAFSLGTRMHSSILSLVAGTPTFPVAVWPKVRKVFDPLGLDDHVVSFPDFDPEDIVGRIAQDLASGEGARSRMRAVVDLQLEQLREFEKLLSREGARA